VNKRSLLTARQFSSVITAFSESHNSCCRPVLSDYMVLVLLASLTVQFYFFTGKKQPS